MAYITDPQPATLAHRSASVPRNVGLLVRLQRADGQAMVEFALAVPLILLLVLGVLDFGRAYNYK